MAYDRTLGILEVRGMAALMGATDAMLKVADVRICGRHGIGSGWVTVAVEGEVAAVQTAIGVGREEAEACGDTITAEVIPRPEARAVGAMPHRQVSGSAPAEGAQALGVLETLGLIPLIAGADAMVKAAAVEAGGWAAIGGTLAHVVVRGDVAAVQAAVASGRRAAEGVGEVVATLVIPQPAGGLGALFPPPCPANPVAVGALGVLETTGYAGAVGGSDAMVKAADVEVLSMTLGSGGRVASLVSGDLDAVQAAVAAGAEAARCAGELNGSLVIPRPAPDAMACFGRTVPGAGRPAPSEKAMGLIETRSTVALVKAVDSMLKAAGVAYEGGYKVGYFLTAGVIRGDVGAVRVALDAGAAEAAKHGERVSVYLIPHPFAELERCLVHR